MIAAFWILSILMLIFGVMVIGLRNPVACALSLVMCFICLAGLFITLDAYFIGIIQILVYAGAVMVLFLFIVMLLDLKVEEHRKFNLLALPIGIALAGGFVFLVARAALGGEFGSKTLPPLPEAATAGAGLDDVRRVGETLFTTFNLPFQVVGVLLLVATVGVVILSKRELR